jgi:hypothetical protein
MSFHGLADIGRERHMKSRTLELESMEDRTAPASLISCAPPAVPVTNPVSGVVARPQPAPALTAVATQADSFGKLATDHNETLVRNRTRARKRP